MAIPQVEQILHTFSGRATSSPYYEAITDNLTKRKALSPGQIAPDFTLLKPDSSSLTLSSLRGKYVMIDFWASWCHPCREAIPHWKKIYEKYHVKGFEILSVSDDNDWKMWKTAMDKEKMPWHQVCDEFPERYKPARVGALYMTHFIPFYVLLDKEGKILVYTGKEGEIDAALEKLLG
jgi:thiol-disulfide isomerase/thioredoxin